MTRINTWIRRIHRWLALPFLLAVIVVIVGGILQGETYEAPAWLGLIAIGSILLLALTGVYMFVQHYWSTWRRKVRTSSNL
jgi:ABC-type nickel/cobalt efflux system permease component RcnA